MNAAQLPYTTTKSRYWSPRHATVAEQFAELTTRIAGHEYVTIHYFGKELIVKAYKADGSQAVVRMWDVDRNRVKFICNRLTTRYDIDALVSRWLMQHETLPYELTAMLFDICDYMGIREGNVYIGASVVAQWEIVLHKPSYKREFRILPKKIALAA